jgi:iron-siderophore transport system substrate-binding protein
MLSWQATDVPAAADGRGQLVPISPARTVAVAAAIVLGLSACGDGGQPAAPQNGPDGSAPSGFPVTIAHRYGSTVIEAEPQRIVAVGLVEQDALLALGVVPVATTEWFGGYPGAVWPWAQDELAGAPPPEVLTDVDGIQFERIAALQPDLIIGLYSGMSAEDYETLSQIAPTVAQPPDVIDYGVSWQELTRTVGQALGRVDRAEELIAGVEERFAAAREANPNFAGATGLMATTFEGYWVYGAEDPRGRFLLDLGFRMPDGLDEITGDEFGANISRERTDLLDTDVLIWLVESYDPDKAAVHGDPLYAQLAVKTEGRDVFLENEEQLGGATSFITPLSLPFLLDGLVPQIAAAVDGDPATEVQRAPATN